MANQMESAAITREKGCEHCATCTRTLFKDYSTEHFHALADSGNSTSDNSTGRTHLF